MDEDVKKALLTKSKRARMEQRGKLISFLCIAPSAVVVPSFTWLPVRVWRRFWRYASMHFPFFFERTESEPARPDESLSSGALAHDCRLLYRNVPPPLEDAFAIGAAVFMTEISPKQGQKILQPVIELLVGIPSVVYGFIGLSVIVPAVRSVFGGTGFGILAGTFVLFIMILPTVTTMTVDALKAVPRHYREASLALGATRWQTIYKVVLRAAVPGILTAVVFGMARAFGEALAIQMVIGNAALMPNSLVTPASPLTSILTMGIGNTIMGTVENNVLWSLALILFTNVTTLQYHHPLDRQKGGF